MPVVVSSGSHGRTTRPEVAFPFQVPTLHMQTEDGHQLPGAAGRVDATRSRLGLAYPSTTQSRAVPWRCVACLATGRCAPCVIAEADTGSADRHPALGVRARVRVSI